MSPGARALALLLALAGCGSGAQDPVVVAVSAGIAAQLGLVPARVACAPERCDVDVGGTRLAVAVQGRREVTWEAEEVVLTAPLAAHLAGHLAELGLAVGVECGPAVQVLPVDGRLTCRLDGGGAAWVRLGADGAIAVEVALTPEVVAERTAAPGEAGLEQRSRALDSDEAEGPEPRDGDGEREAAAPP